MSSPNWLHIRCNNLSTLKAALSQTGRETEAAAVCGREQQIPLNSHKLMIYFYNDKHAQFPGYTVIEYAEVQAYRIHSVEVKATAPNPVTVLRS